MNVIAKLPTPKPERKASGIHFDNEQRYVRVTKIDNRGYVEFQFSVGDPNLYLEMTLPRAAFDEFFAREQAIHLTDEQASAVDETEKKWRFGDFATDDD
jgi:phenol/toluene 2-monooxygenase (NADH) P0/A0